MMRDYDGKVVLITGGTKGIGLATGLAFGRLGAHAWLTHRWGSADEDEIRAKFEKAGAPAPRIEEADASKGKETVALLEKIKAEGVALKPFTPDVMAAARKESDALLEEFAAEDPAFRKVFDQWSAFRKQQFTWFGVAELAYNQAVSG